MRGWRCPLVKQDVEQTKFHSSRYLEQENERTKKQFCSFFVIENRINHFVHETMHCSFFIVNSLESFSSRFTLETVENENGNFEEEEVNDEIIVGNNTMMRRKFFYSTYNKFFRITKTTIIALRERF